MPVANDSDASCLAKRDDFLKYYVEDEVRKRFFAHETTADYTFSPAVKLETLADFINVLHDEEGFIDDWVSEYISKNANRINERLWQLSVVQERLDMLNQDPGEFACHQQIADCISDEMKRVNVSLKKDGISIVVKCEAFWLANECRTSNYVDTRHLDAPSRRAFEQPFGRHERIYISEIQQVTYGKRVLFDRGGTNESK